MLPLSREISQLEHLKKSLAVYRAVIGQPRQDELLAFLGTHLSEEEMKKLAEECSLDLSPEKPL